MTQCQLIYDDEPLSWLGLAFNEMHGSRVEMTGEGARPSLTWTLSMLPSEAHRLLKSAIEDVALFSLTGRTQIEITGADRASFLHNFCTNHIKGLTTGQGCEAIVTSIKGRILFHVLVFAAAESLWIETEPGLGPALIAHLDRYIITEDVQLIDRTEELAQLYLSGADVEYLRLADPEMPGTHYWQWAGDLALAKAFERTIISIPNPGMVENEGVMVRRFSFGSALGDSIVIPRPAEMAWRTKLRMVGAVEAPPALFEALRIEAGFPKSGVDLTEDHLAQEANRTKLAISFTKGCYLGQEPIARIDALGHVNRLLCGVVINEPAEFPPGSEVFATREITTPAGLLTSTAVWPLTNRGIGLGMLRREIARDGAECFIGPSRTPAHVRLWPGR